ncbi:hypothetical protein GOP47_0008358 [Adiantum capillus-veneris]|uniref:Uncharacterized protein n=1 Tax=Adiantum capillus-veneris TaxID=13818 RepID=A0A9D4UZ64_ADICA|nr:hypothetical protein GOP47_0008358 [Adiantum capillus-veneris]
MYNQREGLGSINLALQAVLDLLQHQQTVAEKAGKPGIEATPAYVAGAASGGGCAATSSGHHVESGIRALPAYEASSTTGCCGGAAASTGQHVQPEIKATPVYAAGATGDSSDSISNDDAARVLLRANADAFYRSLSAEQNAQIDDFVQLARGGTSG